MLEGMHLSTMSQYCPIGNTYSGEHGWDRPGVLMGITSTEAAVPRVVTLGRSAEVEHVNGEKRSLSCALRSASGRGGARSPAAARRYTRQRARGAI